MYKVDVDRAKKLVKFVVSGFIKLDEINACSDELDAAMKQFKPMEAVFMVNLTDFKPASNEVAAVIGNMQSKLPKHFRKIASVHTSALAQMQMKRTAQQGNANEAIARFQSEQEAIDFLLS